jgi:hypothetical protein
MDYNQLFEQQPEHVRQQLPERFRQQLEAGADLIVADSEEFGQDLLRVQAGDFAREGDEKYSCRIRLSGLIGKVYGDDGPNVDEKGNSFFSCLFPRYDENGEETLPEYIPGEKNAYLQGFKSQRIEHELLYDAGFINDDVKQYLDDQAKAWVELCEEYEDPSAPYNLEDENGTSLVTKYMGLITTPQIQFELEIRLPQQMGTIERYGITNLGFPDGIQRLSGRETVHTERAQKPKINVPKGTPKPRAKNAAAGNKRGGSRISRRNRKQESSY